MLAVQTAPAVASVAETLAVPPRTEAHLFGAVMRDIKLERDGEWLVIVTTRYRHDREPKINRTYLTRDEAALVVELLTRELPPVLRSPSQAGDLPR